MVYNNQAGYDTAPSLQDLRDNPPNHPEFQSPKNGPDRKVKNPGGGNDMGWLDRKDEFGYLTTIMETTPRNGIDNAKMEMVGIIFILK